MNTYLFWEYLLIMAGVTYLIRVLPLVLFKRKITSTFVKSFLFYVPYAVLGAMTFPAIFFSTGNVYCAAAGCAVACLLAFKEKSLLMVAIFACLTVLLTQSLLGI
jgi:branched-subunit amino acid transport protein